jgi:transcriptional regulator with XRE-family HTH domain
MQKRIDPKTLKTHDRLLVEDLKDSEFRANWERLAAARVLAHALIRYRADHGLTQTELARLLTKSQPAVARWELAEHEPTLETLRLVANRLGVEFALSIGPSGQDPSLVDHKAVEEADAVERVAAAEYSAVLATTH